VKRAIIRSGAAVFLIITLLCSCAQKPSVGSGKKEPVPEDTFVPSTLDGHAEKISDYTELEGKVTGVFSDTQPTDADAFEYSVSDAGVKIEKYTGSDVMVVIPSRIEDKAVIEISEGAFSDSDVRSVYIPDSVKKINIGAFSNMASLQLLRLPFIGDGAENTHIGYVFGAKTFESNAVNIPVSLETVIVGDMEDKVCEKAFWRAKSIDAIVLEGVKEIGKFAFYECDELSYIGLPDTLESVNDYAFSTCISLSKIELPQSVKSMGIGVFYLCKSLCEISIPIIGDGAENTHFGYIFGAEHVDWNEDFVPTALAYVKLTSPCAKIENKAFANCKNIVRVEFPDTLESIGIRAFVNCRSLESVTTPVGLKTVSDDAFFGCDNMQSLTIKGATKVGRQAFFGCDKLTEKNISDAATVDATAFDK